MDLKEVVADIENGKKIFSKSVMLSLEQKNFFDDKDFSKWVREVIDIAITLESKNSNIKEVLIEWEKKT